MIFFWDALAIGAGATVGVVGMLTLFSIAASLATPRPRKRQHRPQQTAADTQPPQPRVPRPLWGEQFTITEDYNPAPQTHMLKREEDARQGH